MNKEINHTCDECGVEANRLTCLKKHGQEPKKKQFSVSTYHVGICDCCGEEVSPKEAKGSLDFTVKSNHGNRLEYSVKAGARDASDEVDHVCKYCLIDAVNRLDDRAVNSDR